METTMQINRETAMSLWNKQFGKADKVKDFAGREMAKGAYDDRNSQYGWNVDHILPVSRGGKTTDSNLICCHILTNDEKADKFPCFTANERQFEIRKVENHYEIKERTPKQEDDDEEEAVNFYDSAAGIRLYKNLKGIQNKPVFVGTVTVRLRAMRSTAVLDFIAELFSGMGIDYKKTNAYLSFSEGENILITATKAVPLKEDIQKILNDCVVLKTYMESYFQPLGEAGDCTIFFGVHSKSNKLETLYAENNFQPSTMEYSRVLGYSAACDMFINELVKINTDANTGRETQLTDITISIQSWQKT